MKTKVNLKNVFNRIIVFCSNIPKTISTYIINTQNQILLRECFSEYKYNSVLKDYDFVFDKGYSGLLFIDGQRHLVIDKDILESKDHIVLIDMKIELIDNKEIIENRLNNPVLSINHRKKTLLRNVINNIENRIKYIDEKMHMNPSFESLFSIKKPEFELIVNRVKHYLNGKKDLARFVFAFEEKKFLKFDLSIKHKKNALAYLVYDTFDEELPVDLNYPFDEFNQPKYKNSKRYNRILELVESPVI